MDLRFYHVNKCDWILFIFNWRLLLTSGPKKEVCGVSRNTIINSLLIYDSSLSKAIQVVHLHLLPGYVSDPQVHVPKLLVLLLYSFVESPGNLINNKSNKFKRNYSHILGVYSCISASIMITVIQNQKNKMTVRQFVIVTLTLMTLEPILKEPVLSFWRARYASCLCTIQM